MFYIIYVYIVLVPYIWSLQEKLLSSPLMPLWLYLLLKILLAQVNKDQIGCKATAELSVALIIVAFPGKSLFVLNHSVHTATFIFPLAVLE